MQQTSCMHTARTERDTRERGEFSQWHRLLRKKIWVLLIGVEPTTFWLLVQMLFHILPSRHSKVFITQFGRGALWWGFISNFCIVPKSSRNRQNTQEDKQRTEGEWYILKRMVETFLMLPFPFQLVKVTSSSNDAISTAFIAISNSYDETSTWIV